MSNGGYLVDQEVVTAAVPVPRAAEPKQSVIGIEVFGALNNYCSRKEFHLLSVFFSIVKFLHFRYRYDESRYDFSAGLTVESGKENRVIVKVEEVLGNDLTFYDLCKQTDERLRRMQGLGKVLQLFDSQASTATINLQEGEDNICRVVLNKQPDGKTEVSFYCADTHDFATVFKRSNTHFLNVLHAIINTDQKLIRDFDYMTVEEQHMVNAYSNGPVDEKIAFPECLNHIFETTCATYPENPCILAHGKITTYADINKKANRLARFLVARNVNPGDNVGILLRRSAEVYISMLAILKIGAAYVPLDPGFPKDRIKYIMGDCSAKLLITDTSFDITEAFDRCIDIKAADYDTNAFDDTNPNLCDKEHLVEKTAYIIYTSGTTGHPKGVLIKHRNISNLVKAEGAHFNVNSHDRVLQGFSVAFDASLEEIWLAFYAGALLVVATDEAMHSGEAIAQYLVEKEVTIFSTVPTMLSMMQPPIPMLRLLILGGEAASHEVLARWQSPSLRVVNSYGPTEATVIASFSDFNAAKEVTIGKPIINYTMLILDADGNQVPIGVPGEILIGGRGVAAGYLNRPELDKEKFVMVPPNIHFVDSECMYRSGDLGRLTNDGEIAFLGRIDTQVKIRGFRIELAEIEARIMQCTGVSLAVMKVQEGVNKAKRLVAYVKEDTPGSFNEENVKEFLRAKLAAYMMPSVFMVLEEFPYLASGKVDRKKLPEPDMARVVSSSHTVPPRTETEKIIHGLWEKYFHPNPVSIYDDFFELGGYSLLAAMLVSELRKQEGMAALSVEDIYKNPVLEKFAAHADAVIEKHKANNTGKSTQKHKVKPANMFVFATTALLQLVSVIFFYTLTACFMLLPYYYFKEEPTVSYQDIFLVVVLTSLLMVPAMMVISIIVKWLFIGKFRAGRHKLWGFYYFRFWFVKKFIEAIPLTLLSGTPFLAAYFRAMGAKIGRRVYLGTDRIRIFDLTTIGDGSSVLKEANLMGYTVQDGQLIIGSITIGKDCVVGLRTLVSYNGVMHDHAVLGELSLIPPGEQIPSGEYWQGSPARFIHKETVVADTPAAVTGFRYFMYSLGQSIAALGLFVIPLFVSFPFVLIGYWVLHHWGFNSLIICLLPMTALYIITYCLLVAAIKWTIVGRSKEEDISIYSGKYIRKWFVDNLIQITLLSFRSIYATIYLPSWLRLMGAKIGKRAEISTVNQISTDLLEVGSGSFLADSVSIGSPLVSRGVMRYKITKVGSRTFIGNSAVLISGKEVGNNALIGVLSIPPANKGTRQTDNTSWLGSPPMFLPRRQIAEGFTEAQTFSPPVHMVVLRGFIEFFRITLPLAIPSALILMFYHLITMKFEDTEVPWLIMHATVLFIYMSLIMVAIAVVAKWLLVGKYKPKQKPLWSTFVWRNELVNSLCESMAYPYVVNFLLGTPFAPVFFRLMGASFGKKVFMETTELTEFDLVKVKNNVSLNFGCTIQTHLFEDRVMKMSYLHIMDNCTIGAMAVVLYNSEMDQYSSLNGLSLLMKGEVLPAHTKWQGSPARLQ
ncbi:MAG: amino acid adenylation domain-containing protein [Taibaiella sp.]|nr:amino acid adenylation domain-containing protein [Taibaiella sp.]